MAAPSQITDLVATGGIEQANLAWTPPTSSPAITSYDIEFKLNSSSIWILFIGTGLSSDIDIFDLTNALYDFRVRAVNIDGPGDFSAIQTATPTLIGPANYLELNEQGFSSGPVAVTNTGTDGSSRDFTTQSGSGPALTPIIHKGRNAWFSTDDRSLKAASAQSTKNHPQCVYICFSPTNGDSNFRRLWSSSPAQSNATLRSTESRMDSGGGGLGGAATDTSGAEFIIFYRFNGGSSSIRVIKNGGGDTTSGGNTNAGSNIAPAFIFWDSSETFGEDVNGDCYEFGAFDGSVSSAEENAKIDALKQKWFVGFPDRVPAPLMCWDETSIISSGEGTQVTAWNNIGSTSGDDDFDSVTGTPANLTEGVRNGLPIVVSTGGARMRVSSASVAILQPYTIYIAWKPSAVDANLKYLLNSTSGSEIRFNSTEYTASSGTPLGSGVAPTIDGVVMAFVSDGANSRFKGEGAATWDVAGNSGGDDWQTNNLFWDDSQTVNLDTAAEIFEIKVYMGAHTTEIINSIMGSLQEKWLTMDSASKAAKSVSISIGLNL